MPRGLRLLSDGVSDLTLMQLPEPTVTVTLTLEESRKVYQCLMGSPYETHHPLARKFPTIPAKEPSPAEYRRQMLQKAGEYIARAAEVDRASNL